jgi:UDP-2,4-diacetamido-2,4,6-trideoxy-beta-L-altropyranose hydrolase
MKIGFYTWGDPVMGMGHIFRCLALAKEARRQLPAIETVFELKAREPGVSIVRNAGEALNSWPDDTVPPGPWDILVVDQLQADPLALTRLRQWCRCLVSLDDAGPGHWASDLAIGSLYACTVPPPPDSTTLSLSGLDYTLIDRAFAAQPFTIRPTPGNLFLTQGGSDTWNMLSVLVGALTPWLIRHGNVTLHVHTGPAFEHERDLAQALAALPTPWRRHGRVADLPGLMADMDMAITAGGVMTLELLAVGVPCITITAEEKEMETISALAHRGLVHNLGFRKAATAEKVSSALDHLFAQAHRQTLSETTRLALDGRGAERIIKAALDLTERSGRRKGLER